MNILIVGGYDVDEDSNVDDIRTFCRALGTQVIEQGHTLINGCQTEFDAVVAKAAYERLQTAAPDDVTKRLISYVLAGTDPVHDFGRILRSRLTSWDPGKDAMFVPEPVQIADVVILVRGFNGTNRAAWWARFARIPLLPVACFDGAASEIYSQEFDAFDERYSGRVESIDFQELSSASKNWPSLATNVVSLAEIIAISKSALVIMSYTGEDPMKTDLDNAFANFEIVCKKYGYECERVDETNTKDSIVSEIFKKIDQAAFIIADLTELKQNVFFELGYARGLKKNIIVTAKENTELPFDVKDVPVTFWAPVDQVRLRSDLEKRIEPIAKSHGWSP